jgi:hypothetical protein
MTSNSEKLGFWTPGIKLLRRYRFSFKFGVLAGTLLIPLIVITLLLLQRQTVELSVTEAELEGLTLIRTVMRVTTLVQKHRGQTNVLLSGNTSIRSELDKTRAELAQASEETQAASRWGKACVCSNSPAINRDTVCTPTQ